MLLFTSLLLSAAVLAKVQPKVQLEMLVNFTDI